MAALERRIKAAQELAGFKSLDDIAAAIGRESQGFSRKTLRRIANENDPRTAKDYELEWIADACDVPISFLLDGPAPASPTLDARLERIEAALTAASDERQQIQNLLTSQQHILEDMQRVAAGLPDQDALNIWNDGVRQITAASEALRAARSATEAAPAGTPHRRAANE